jgi:hypothetical protein
MILGGIAEHGLESGPCKDIRLEAGAGGEIRETARPPAQSSRLGPIRAGRLIPAGKAW